MTVFVFNDTAGASFSYERRFRHLLWRRWSDAPLVGVVGLNPSTADESKNDPTTDAILKHAGFGGYVLGNVYDYAATDPDDLKRAGYPKSDFNRTALRVLFAASDVAPIAAWGARARVEDVARLPVPALGWQAWGVNGNGSPKHPLYLATKTTLAAYTMPSAVQDLVNESKAALGLPMPLRRANVGGLP